MSRTAVKSDPRDKLQQDFLMLADSWIERACGEQGANWFRRSTAAIARRADPDALTVAIGLASRKLGKADLSLTSEDLAHATALREGLEPSMWSVDQLARIAFMAASYTGDDVAFAARFNDICATAELNELIALCRGLPVFPAGDLLEPRAREAVRSGVKPVFEAVAQRNPYPGDYFDEDAFNQMVVKAVFIEASLWPIRSLDRRGNPKLARMLVDLARERWAAGRSITPEVWRCIAPHADAGGLSALVRAIQTGTDKEQLAVVLALRSASAIIRDGVIIASGRGATIEGLAACLDGEAIDWPMLA